MDSNAAGMFANGEIAMFQIGTWFQQQFIDAGMTPGEDFDAFVLPNLNPDLAEKVIVVESGPFAIPTNAPNAEAGLEFFNWWVSPRRSRPGPKSSGDAPANPKAQSTNPILASLISTLGEQQYRFMQRYWEASPPPIVESAVDELGRFMLNPDEYQSVLETIEGLAQASGANAASNLGAGGRTNVGARGVRPRPGRHTTVGDRAQGITPWKLPPLPLTPDPWRRRMQHLTDRAAPLAKPTAATVPGVPRQWAHRLAPYLFLVPAVALVGGWLLWPFARTAYLSLTEFKGIGAVTFVGAGNYTTLLDDPILTDSFTNTLSWVVGTLLLPVGIGLLIAVLTYELTGGALYRLPFLLPYALSGTAIGVMWEFMLRSTGGANSLLALIGLERLQQSWLLKPPLNTWSMIVAFDLAVGRRQRPPLPRRLAGAAARAARSRPPRRRRRLAALPRHHLPPPPPDDHRRRRHLPGQQPQDLRRHLGDDPGRPLPLLRDARRHHVPRDLPPLPPRLRLGHRRRPQRDRPRRLLALPQPDPEGDMSPAASSATG
jgi:hypothetical protein